MRDNPAEVYRTTLPEALEAWDTYATRRHQWYEKVRAFAKEHSGTHQFWGNTFLGQDYFLGLTAPDNDAEIPTGWRRDRRQPNMMVPNRRTPEGKKCAAAIKKFANAPHLTLGGMPNEVDGEYNPDGSHRVHSFGAQRLDDALEVSWSVPVPPEKVDSTIWQKVPLSQWHAEREAAAS
ncbi:hypothetical protein RAJCM14343_5837 [Rhodococcus aetherivorans]|uniref:Uncharacterized protein n=1 Tax=Rhodococcus aetherivorans TaxID=191292 RepID=A0ABQ0YVS9_9NOCA|nr:hypothetical protein [Rhodococcus aetherivorans]ETT26272.1 hypothetical protein RR21198_3150 [Rhodococcus rhodochrous ATCC 21198]NGP25868.1 hypothetical protein [Rhodococcus aetherivorans]GES40547.1 hypothetical protein RAJCM14343_5837 [Rhodococcus aetherivorans]